MSGGVAKSEKSEKSEKSGGLIYSVSIEEFLRNTA